MLVVTKVSLVGQFFIENLNLKEAPDTTIDHKIIIQKLIKYCLNLNSVSLFMCYHLLSSNVVSMAIYPLLVKLHTVLLKVLYLDRLVFVYLEMRNVFFWTVKQAPRTKKRGYSQQIEVEPMTF